MPACCAVFGCKNVSTDKKVSFHKFPRSEVFRKKWANFCRRKNWYPTSSSNICSAHFEDDCYMIDPLVLKSLHIKRINRLKPGAIPSLLRPDCHGIVKIKPPRQAFLKRRRKELVQQAILNSTSSNTVISRFGKNKSQDLQFKEGAVINYPETFIEDVIYCSDLSLIDLNNECHILSDLFSIILNILNGNTFISSKVSTKTCEYIIDGIAYGPTLSLVYKSHQKEETLYNCQNDSKPLGGFHMDSSTKFPVDIKCETSESVIENDLFKINSVITVTRNPNDLMILVNPVSSCFAVNDIIKDTIILDDIFSIILKIVNRSASICPVAKENTLEYKILPSSNEPTLILTYRNAIPKSLTYLNSIKPVSNIKDETKLLNVSENVNILRSILNYEKILDMASGIENGFHIQSSLCDRLEIGNSFETKNNIYGNNVFTENQQCHKSSYKCIGCENPFSNRR